MQPLDVSDIGGDDEAVFVNTPRNGPPRILSLRVGRSGIVEVMPKVDEFAVAIGRELRSRGRQRGIRVKMLRTSSGQFWFTLRAAATFPWTDTSLADAQHASAIRSWSARDHLILAHTLLRGLASLHSHQVIHGDITAHNIMCRDRTHRPDTFVLAEFGRFCSPSPLVRGHTYILAGDLNQNATLILPDGIVLVQEYDVATTILVAIERNDHRDMSTAVGVLCDPPIRRGEAVASREHFVVVGSRVFDSRVTWRHDGRVISLCNKGHWTVNGRFLSPERGRRTSSWRVESLSLLDRPTFTSDLQSLGMLLLDNLADRRAAEIAPAVILRAPEVAAHIASRRMAELHYMLKSWLGLTGRAEDSVWVGLDLTLIAGCLAAAGESVAYATAAQILEENRTLGRIMFAGTPPLD